MHARHALAALALSATASVAAAQSPGVAMSRDLPQIDCAAPSGLDQRRACEAARQGVEPLRRFAHITRHIYAIHAPQYLAAALDAERRQGRADVRDDATKVAEAK
jgi:hypothetical protein